MKYKSYLLDGEGKTLTRRQRKAQRRAVFSINKTLHSRRSKAEAKEKAKQAQ